jgi:hypothetical protein
MLSLRELQQRFVDGLLGGDAAAILPVIGDHGPGAAKRFAVYRNNCRAGFLAALEAGYPVLRRLTGPEYFRQLVGEYQRAHPSPSGNLAHAGTRLPGFLDRRFAGTEYEYFGDVARLERACQEVQSAADRPPLDLQRLAAVSPADYPRLRFEPDPAAQLFASPWPVVTIWEAHQGTDEPGAIDLGAGPERAVVRRRDEGVVLYRLPPPEFAGLAALAAARPLGAALEAALALDDGFDLRAALVRWTRLGFIAGFSVTGESADT